MSAFLLFFFAKGHHCLQFLIYLIRGKNDACTNISTYRCL